MNPSALGGGAASSFSLGAMAGEGGRGADLLGLQSDLRLRLPFGLGAGLALSADRPRGLPAGLRWELGLGLGLSLGSTDLGLGLRQGLSAERGSTVDLALTQSLGGLLRVHLGARDLAAREGTAPEIGLGLGLRPGLRWLGLHAYGTFVDDPEPRSLSAVLRLSPTGGLDLDLGAELQRPFGTASLHVFARLRLGFGAGGLHELGWQQGPGNASESWALSARSTFSGAPHPSLLGPAPVAWILDVPELTEEAPEGRLIGSSPPSFTLAVHALLQALERPETRALILRVPGGGIGWGQAGDLRAVVRRYRKAGRKVVALLRAPSGPGLYLALAADRIYLDPAGGLNLTGLYRAIRFIGPLLSTIGVKVQFVRHAEYKSFPERLTGSAPSKPFREAEERLLDVFEGELLAALSERTRRPPAGARALVDEGPYTAPEARSKGLVDDLLAPEEAVEPLRRDLGIPGLEMRTLSPARHPSATGWGRAPAVALIVVRGDIVAGHSRRIPGLGLRMAGEDDVVAALDAAREGPYAAALVRLDTPGGSVLASEGMARALGRLAKVKPVVISMGDVAASGGFMLATGARVPIVSAPLTITGSIGIFALKPVHRELTDRLGMPVTELSRGKHAGLWSATRPWTEAELTMLRTKLGSLYRRFVGRVARARGRSAEEIEPLCRGRVWAGIDAERKGLIDGVGGLPDALDRVAALAGLGARDTWDLVRLGRPPGLLERLVGAVAARGEPSSGGAAGELMAEVVGRLGLAGSAWMLLATPGAAQARLPLPAVPETEP